MTTIKNSFVEIRKGVYAYQFGRIQEKRKTCTGKIELYRPVKLK